MDLVLDFEKVKAIMEVHSMRVDSLIDRYVGRPEQLVSLLQDVQAEFKYLPRDVLTRISQRLDLPLVQVVGVATFFRAFSLAPRGRHVVTVCLGTACHVKSGDRLVDKLQRDLGIAPGETTEDMRFTLDTVNCMGCCAISPVAVIDGKFYGKMTPDKLDRVMEKYE